MVGDGSGHQRCGYPGRSGRGGQRRGTGEDRQGIRGDHLPELVQDCIQIHGGIGVTWEHDIHLYLRRVAANKFLYGDPSEHRDTLAGLLLSQV